MDVKKPLHSQGGSGASRPSFGGAPRPAYQGGAGRPGGFNNTNRGPRPGGPGGASRGGFGGRPGGPGGNRPGGPGGKGGRDGGPGRKGQGKYDSEFGQKIIDIRRVARVVAGGRRFSFSVCVVIGDKKGRVGVGMGKAGDTALAIEKAVSSAKKHMSTVSRTDTNSIPHEVKAKYSSARVVLMPAPGRGLVAGSSVRPVLDLAGVTNITTKLLSGTKNKLNNAQATIKALGMLSMPRASHATAPKEETAPAEKMGAFVAE